jgi:hypothetical protein
LRIQTLTPAAVTGQTEIQNIEGTGGSNRNKPKGLLRLANAKKTRQTVFVTFLHAYPTGTKPTADLTVQFRGGKIEMKLKRVGRSRSFVVDGPSTPI